MKPNIRKYINRQSSRGKIIEDCDKLLSKIVRIERKGLCEVHGRECPGIGASHILPKSTHSRLHYHKGNLFLACWFGSHYFTHHDSHDPRAIQYEQAIIRKLGKDYREHLLIVERTSPRLTTLYLQNLRFALTQELKELEGK